MFRRLWIVGGTKVILGQFRRKVWIDVEKSPYHQQSQSEIDGDNPCSRHLSECIAKKEAGCTIVRISQLKEKVWRRVVS